MTNFLLIIADDFLLETEKVVGDCCNMVGVFDSDGGTEIKHGQSRHISVCLSC